MISNQNKITLPRKRLRTKNLSLFFKEDTHEYFLIDGRGKIKYKLPSVTQILSSIFPVPFYIKKDKLKIAAELGTAVHKATEDYDKYKRESNLIQLKGYKKWKEDYNPEILYIESSRFHPKFLYAGTIDRVIIIDGKKYIVDIKSGIKIDWHPLQLALYVMMLDEDLGRAGLYLDKQGEYDFRIYDNELDFNAAYGVLAIGDWKGLWSDAGVLSVS